MKTLLFIVLVVPIVMGQPQPNFSDNCLVQNAAGTCSTCREGFYLEIFLCLPCAPLCRCYSQYNYCEQCVNRTFQNTKNYYQLSVYNEERQRCLYCYIYMPFCLQCTNHTHCSQCFGGRYPLSSSAGTNCSNLICQANCEICHNSTACELCQQGYFLNGHTCSPVICQPNCLTCSSPTACGKCLPGFRAVIGICVACESNCLQCNSLQCLNCQPGYYYVSGSGCTSTGYNNCIVYQGGAAAASNCMVCEPGYYVYFGNCIQCVGCNECALMFLCESSCLQNTTPFNYACLVPFTFGSPWLLVPVVLLLLFLS